MPFLEKQEKNLLKTLSDLAYCNLFSPLRVEFERQILGADFEEVGPVWSLDMDDPDRPLANDWKVYKRVDDLVRSLSQRLDKSAKATREELVLYEDAVLFVLYHRYVGAMTEAAFTSGSEAVSARRWRFYQDYRRDWSQLLEVSGVSFPTSHEPAHTFACYFQIRRAFLNTFHHIVGSSPSVARLRETIWESIFSHDFRRYRRTLYRRMGDFPTLITGPSGTGKELVARAIAFSRYLPFDEAKCEFKGMKGELFFAVNLAALPATLIESEVFGHRRGSFTGAVEDRKGWFEVCPSYGTVFLDEIGELEPELQVKLLRVIETRSFQPVGETAARTFAGKIVAATNRDLGQAMGQGRFREDLYYRLCADQVTTPSLRRQLEESPEVLDDLILFMARRVAGDEGETLAKEVRAWVGQNLRAAYPWPGNYRELEQCVRNILVHRRYEPRPQVADHGAAGLLNQLREGEMTAEQLLSAYVTWVYHQTGSYQETARRLEIDRRTVKSRVDVTLLQEFRKDAN
ncbi:MAG: sigma-54 factor interaction domain-containing protein [Acidobacteria bacterium]|nr:sigma-54 factor interaction domain-containing protein [Acidobacteriota bacterium]